MTKLKDIKYTGHHNIGPLHIAADIAVIATVAGAMGAFILLVVLAFVALLVVMS